MPNNKTPVLIDTNVIIESHRVSAWKALAGGHRLETVKDCVIETQTGFQLRKQEQQILQEELREKLAAVHPIHDREYAELAVRIEGIALDRGEGRLATVWSRQSQFEVRSQTRISGTYHLS